MSELRWILLLLGVGFVAGLFLWERRKQPPRELGTGAAAEAGAAGDAAADWTPPVAAPPARPAATLPATLPGPLSGPLPGPLPEIRAAREPLQPLPVIELPDEPPDHQPHDPPCDPPDEPPDAVKTARPGGLRLAWADEPERQIIAIRVVPIIERFGGRAARQALAGEGFLHGPLGIFHRALPDGRVVLSCASLTKPGSFDLATMDSQRYAGLNIFGVLPGPLSSSAALEDLLAVSRTIASRLGGVVQDERGRPLDAARIVALREQFAADATLRSRPPGAPVGAPVGAPSGTGENASP